MRTRRRHLGASDEHTRSRRDLVLGLVVLGVTALAVYLSTVSIGGGPLQEPYLVRAQLPADGPLLKDGDEVRIAGHRAGEVRAVDRGTGATQATLALEDGPIGRDARVRTRLRGLAGAVVVEVDPGSAATSPLPSGGALRGTAETVELGDVIEAFDATTRDGLRRTLRGYGTGLAGRGDDLASTISATPETARRLATLLRAPGPGDLAALTAGLDRTLEAVEADGELERLVVAARRTLDAVEPDTLERSVALLPPFEAEVAASLPAADRLLVDVRDAAPPLHRATRALRRALPSLREVARRDAALDELARIGRAAAPVLRIAAPVVRGLRPAAAQLGPLAGPLGPLAAHLARYEREIFLAPDGFTRWGGFSFDEGQAKGAMAVRFSMVFTCHLAREPYPEPGAALDHAKRCVG